MKSTFLPIFTIGHGRQPISAFVSALRQHRVEYVLDVRSYPYSGRSPHFDRTGLSEALKSEGIQYSFGGNALGGRPRTDDLYTNGRADYIKMSKSAAFLAGLKRVASAARRHRVALLCAETDPIECHRFLLIGRVLHESGMTVVHILNGGELEPHANAELRMIANLGLTQPEIFGGPIDVRSAAYESQSSQVAYLRGLNVREDERGPLR